jgi:hypothetical protein
MPRTGKSVVWKIKTACTLLRGTAVQRDTSRTRSTRVICTCWCAKCNNSWDTKMTAEILVLDVFGSHISFWSTLVC